MIGQTLELFRLPWPVDWPALFGRKAPLIVEIGFGNGQFLEELARRHPDHNLLGLEISLPSLRRAQRRLRQDGLTHVRLLPATAQAALQMLCRPQIIETTYINFPDPWPKAAHHGRRLISDEFLDLLASRMAAGSRLEIATDHADYADWIEECLQRTPYFESRLKSAFVTEDNERLRTKYERKALAEGRVCRYFKWQRNHTAASQFSPPAEYAMPHMTLQAPLTFAAAFGRFEPHSRRHGEIRIRYIEAFQSQQKESFVIDTYVGEAPLEQRLLLAVTRRQDDFLLHLHEVGYPRVTLGIHVALRCLGEWLQSLDAAVELSSHNLQPAAFEKEMEQ